MRFGRVPLALPKAIVGKTHGMLSVLAQRTARQPRTVFTCAEPANALFDDTDQIFDVILDTHLCFPHSGIARIGDEREH